MAEKIPKTELDKVKERFKDDLALINRYFEARESTVIHSLAFTLRRYPDTIPSLIQVARKIQSEGTPTNKGDGAAYARSISTATFKSSKEAARVRDVLNKFKFRFLILPIEPSYRRKKRKTPAQEEAEKELGRIANEELAERQTELAESAELLTKAQAEPRAEELAGLKKPSASLKYPAYLITPETLDVILADRLKHMKDKLSVVAGTQTMNVIDFLIDQLKKGA